MSGVPGGKQIELKSGDSPGITIHNSNGEKTFDVDEFGNLIIGAFNVIGGTISNTDGQGKIVIQNGSTFPLSSQGLSFGWVNPGGLQAGTTYATIKNTRVPNVPGTTENITLLLNASGATNNYALDMPTGKIRTAGNVGVTANLNIGGVHMKFVNGLYVGTW